MSHADCCLRSSTVKFQMRIESDIRDIRKLLKSYMTRLENKDLAARTTKEWRIVARVLDRIFFFCYIGTIVVSLFTIFPRDGGERELSLSAVTTTPSAEPDPTEYVEPPVTTSDLLYSYDDYGYIQYR